ncbi:hypothetical protein CI105_04600 [Candidatus Izimaplasma bacterium ZiA1]|uniref:hypothetical protein n=1 Tax=Candidatus Izimoplasma sp. ZiA1 TaxID=2024899 RepID=UPI000BAA5669|nr:hypothetical protein CI105_04600 [Candidatus Izimaplasma bacterium ZiA1]
MKTIKVILPNGLECYLYHGGPFQSHRLYTESTDHLKKITFKRLNYSDEYLEKFELERLKKIDPGINAKLVEIEIDSEYKFVKEKRLNS